MLYSTLVDLSVMGATFAIQTFIKESISKKNPPVASQNQSKTRSGGLILPFELRQHKK
jgi:hypothetical protein